MKPGNSCRSRNRLGVVAAISARASHALSLVLAMTCLMTYGAAHGQGVLSPTQQATPPNSLAAAAGSAGIRQCRPQLASLAELGVQGTVNNDLLLDWDHARADGSPVFSLLGLDYASNGAAMSVTAVPEADGSCSVAAERISVEAASCNAVAAKELAGYRRTPLLKHMMVYTNNKEPGSSVSLIDTAAGCLVIRRYVKFQARASE